MDLFTYRNITDGSVFKSFSKSQKSVNAMTLLTNGKLASAGDDKLLQVWSTNNMNFATMSFRAHTLGITSLAALKDGNLASGSVDGYINIWKTNSV